MTPTEFCSWLKGYFDIAQPNALNDNQTSIVKAKLYEVFDHVVEPVVQPKTGATGSTGMASDTPWHPSHGSTGPSGASKPEKKNIFKMTEEEWIAAGRPRC